MDKVLWYPSVDDLGQRTSETLFIPNNTFEKVASSYDDIVQQFISRMKPDTKKYLYMLLHALGAGEYWGANVNGDYFPEAALKHEGEDYGHKTFERYAKLYKHHVNKDPERSYGDVLHSHYDDKMHRVLLIVAVCRNKAPDICKRIEENGEYPDVSMGCKVPWDECSICGHRAKSPREYCNHAKLEMGKIYPDGRKSFVINRFPRFFDISQVFIGAEKPAKFLYKIASSGESGPSHEKGSFFMPGGFEKAANSNLIIPSALLAERMGYSTKSADIVKEVPVESGGVDEDRQSQDAILNGLARLKELEPKMSKSDLKKMASFPLESSMSTLASMGILVKPEEFQYLALTKMGYANSADKLWDSGIVFEPSEHQQDPMNLSMDRFDSQIEKIAYHYMPMRSDLQPHLMGRTITALHNPNKLRPDFQDHDLMYSNAIPAMAAASGLYSAYNAGLLHSMGPVNDAVRIAVNAMGLQGANPAAVMTLAALAALAMRSGRVFSGPSDIEHYSKYASLGEFAIMGGAALAPWIYRSDIEDRAKSGQRIGMVDRFIYKHPTAISAVSTLAGAHMAPKITGAASKAMGYITDVASAGKNMLGAGRDLLTGAAGLMTNPLAAAGTAAVLSAPYLMRENVIRKIDRGDKPGLIESTIAREPGKAALLGGALGLSTMGYLNNIGALDKLRNFATKLSNDGRWLVMLDNVVLNEKTAESNYLEFLGPETTNAGTVLGLAALGYKEDA
jgi:hypothetical protein